MAIILSLAARFERSNDAHVHAHTHTEAMCVCVLYASGMHRARIYAERELNAICRASFECRPYSCVCEKIERAVVAVEENVRLAARGEWYIVEMQCGMVWARITWPVVENFGSLIVRVEKSVNVVF